ncbi:dihydrofolate reductase [Anaerosacchariphilus polymeriproducens]|uniref:Dihydrofolate reductase n=1 Tax=Anaerosacchariphilus polymeriproducens TaxID=1812858 RepID=A0A371AWS9_9FIRM|nr:dihydrofolate reductase [Anaerosacchariphilus polymeriproducens]RDU23999.1 dihydrofolate reductase [Anaerosacchariphilus polymeriproducens]
MKALIVAYSKNKVIGKNGMIPWKIKGEQKRFKELTTDNVVIMGRRSYEEIGRPLPNRLTIVISRTMHINEENCVVAHSLDEALKIAENKNVYISGGARLYEEAINIVDKMYITQIDQCIEGDTFFPEFDESQWEIQIDAEFVGDLSYKYLTYTRKGDKTNRQKENLYKKER